MFTEESLDYESALVLVIRIRATDSLTSEFSEVTVTVSLTDVNDIAPAFPQTSYDLSVLESSPVGLRVAVIKAQDNDTGKCLHSLNSINIS